jgi:hypothetical protein
MEPRLRPLAAVAWLFVACVVVQFFLVGLRLFGVEPWTELHADFAYLYGWLAPVLVLLAAATRAPRRTQLLAVLLLVVFAVQTYLPQLVDVAPWLAALHAPNALVVAWIAIRLAVEASQVPERRGTPVR